MGKECPITTSDALKIADVNGHSITRPTLISWIKKFSFGRKLGGRWVIDKVKFENFLKGEK